MPPFATEFSQMTTFTFLGNTYRTNTDAAVIEVLDGTTWNRTHSIRVYLEAKRILGL